VQLSQLAVVRVVRLHILEFSQSKQRKLLSDALEFSLKGIGKEWLWCVDPIDGTTNFASGLPVSLYSIDFFSIIGQT
jgi:Inositol monophosphatase family